MILNVFLIGVILFISYILFLCLRRINIYENLLEQIYNTIEYANERMRIVDASEHYSSDDEVGFFFEELKKIQDILAQIFVIDEE
tara:strand:- start:18 stop:272 length:255 start_codon:yes stop_codon:yes gene_type:complete